ncbi:hypothetical protein SEA_KWEKEL_7 [Gordonia phage Kwekel]|uniref:Uncharacterized protein n=1 Tax=Gordonia phage Kwekel TaxID=3077820 RepID=A0AA96QV57_9CAUD|nr:hypothetical protein SEA_KWEKEL_7 [Gordonia phage Kwekel]
MPNMMTLFTTDPVSVDVSVTMVTLKTDRKPSDTSRIVDLSPFPPFEVHVAHRYTIRVGGEQVHEVEHWLDDPTPWCEHAKLDDGSVRIATTDGLFSIRLGAPRRNWGHDGAVLTIVERPLDLCMMDGETWFDLGGFRWHRDLRELGTCVTPR